MTDRHDGQGKEIISLFVASPPDFVYIEASEKFTAGPW
jgi:hypothetical protein